MSFLLLIYWFSCNSCQHTNKISLLMLNNCEYQCKIWLLHPIFYLSALRIVWAWRQNSLWRLLLFFYFKGQGYHAGWFSCTGKKAAWNTYSFSVCSASIWTAFKLEALLIWIIPLCTSASGTEQNTELNVKLSDPLTRIIWLSTPSISLTSAVSRYS